MKAAIVLTTLLGLSSYVYWNKSNNNKEEEEGGGSLTKQHKSKDGVVLGNTIAFKNDICPGSPASIHAKCEMTIRFQNDDITNTSTSINHKEVDSKKQENHDDPCKTIIEEVTLRLQHYQGWVDPHNHGTYTLLSSSSSSSSPISTMIKASRKTGGHGDYVDLLNLEFVSIVSNKEDSSSSSSSSCLVRACSESQVTSILDFSTNYCNLHNLYYSGGIRDGDDDSPPFYIRHNITNYQEEYNNCGQRKVEKCS